MWNPASSAWTAVCERRIVFCGMLILIYVRVWSLTMKMYGRSPASPALARWEGEIKLGTIYVGTRRRFTFQLCRRVEDWEENNSPNLKFNCNNKSHINSVSVCHCIMHAWSPYPYPYFVKSVLCLLKSRNVPIVVWQQQQEPGKERGNEVNLNFLSQFQWKQIVSPDLPQIETESNFYRITLKV